MNKTGNRKIVLAAALAALAASAHAVQFEGRGANLPHLAPIKTVAGEAMPNVTPAMKIPELPVAGTQGLESGGVLPEASLIGPDAGKMVAPQGTPGVVPTAPEIGRVQAGEDGPTALGQTQEAAANFADPALIGPGGWTPGARTFDGLSKELAPVDYNSYRGPSTNEGNKISTARSWAAGKSSAFSALDAEFARKGGYFLINDGSSNGALATSGRDRYQRPVIVLSNDLLNRFNGQRWEDEYRGAPWEFIASVIAREQVFSSDYYASIPASAEKLAVSVMNLVKVFVDLTNGTSRSWATDKDFKQNASDPKSYVGWGWFEQLAIAARNAAAGVGTTSGHFIESKFLAWARDWVAPKEAANPAFQFTLWELFDGKYYRPGDARNGQAIPSHVGRIDKATYDRESYKVYGADGKGSDQSNRLDASTIFGWIISWLRGRSEI